MVAEQGRSLAFLAAVTNLSTMPAPADVRTPDLPIGPRLEAVLRVAYRARRPVLLEGPTGIGKSEIVHDVARSLGIDTRILDLSLLEPPDLIGLPVVENGFTSYAVPRLLPRQGEGILMLEELNRAERFIQQPALQLLTARTLHEYHLPEGWVCFAAINPAIGEYHVTPLDAALRARFLNLQVKADRAGWIAWALRHGIHPSVVALAQAQERIFADVPPRTWTFVSRLLGAFTADELRDPSLLRDALGGYLPASWVEALLAVRDTAMLPQGLEVHQLLSDYSPNSAAFTVINGYRVRGETDRLDELTHRLAVVLRGPEAGALIAQGAFSAVSFEALLADLPGDHREKLGEALGGNPTALPLLAFSPAELLHNYTARSPNGQLLASWTLDPLRHYRVVLVVTGICTYLHAKAQEVRKSNPLRTSLGHLLAQLGGRWGMPLVDTLQKLSITPVRPPL